MISHAHTDRDAAAPGSSPGDDKGRRGDRADAANAPHARATLLELLAELVEYAAYYLAVQSDLVRRRARVLAAYAVLAVAGALVGAVVLAAAGVFLVRGLAGGLSVLFDQRVWAGDLVTGLAVPAAAGLVGYLVWRRQTIASRQSVREKYERRQQAQRARFGRDLHDRAAATRRDVRG